MKYLIIALLFVSMPVLSGDFRAGYIFASNHWTSKEYNEEHNGYYFCYTSVCAGRYENSFSGIETENDGIKYEAEKRYSNFIKYDHHIGEWNSINFSVSGGFADGYKGVETDHEWRPYVSVNARISIFQLWQVGTVSVGVLEFGN